MAMNKLILITLASFICFFSATAQKIAYTEPDKDDTKRTNFDIIGKVGGNYLIFKNNRNDNAISVYNADMKLIEKVDIDREKQKWINVDFIPYADNAWMIYQYQQKSVLYCMAVKIDGNGKMLSRPLELDTTRIGWAADNKIYTTIYSDDKRRIMVFKINSRNPKNFVFTTILFDEQLQPIERRQLNMPMEERNEYFTDFLIDNEGTMVFGKYVRRGGDYVTNLNLVTKSPDATEFAIHDMKTGDRVLDDIKIKIDNNNRRYLFSTLYYKQRRGNIEGLYTISWDRGSSSIFQERLYSFSDELRAQAKGPDANIRTAFNDYFIKNIVVRKDGGYIIIAESQYTTSRGGGPFNRWDYMGFNSPWISPYNYYYSPYYYNAFGGPYYNRWGNGSPNRYHSENIVLMSFNRSDSLEWSNVISKTQYDDQTDALISHQMMITGGEIHFLFNLYERRALLLNDQSVEPDGKIDRNPTFKNLDRGIEFMARYGKQVSARSMIIPCQFRNYLIFAKIDF